MKVLIGKFECYARYVMSVVAAIALLGLIAFKQGWISDTPSYKKEAWYLADGNAHVIIASEYGDEASCRRAENASKACRSGKSLLEEFHLGRQDVH